jgi:hypothetical protein
MNMTLHGSSLFSEGSSIHETTYRHRMLQEERSVVVSPRAFNPAAPLRKPLMLKSHPGLAMSPEPPEVPPPGPISPTATSLVASNGYSRSFAGLPWETGSRSINNISAKEEDEDCVSLDNETTSKPEAPQWTPYRTTYSQSFASHDWDHTRVLNHERLRLEGDQRPTTSRTATATPSYQPPSPRHPGLPFGGRR